MLSKKYRLPPTAKLQNFQRFSTQFFYVLVKENDLPYNRFGFVISKKIDKRAVVRNTLKRVLREAVQEFTEKNPGTDILFIVTKTFFNEGTSDIVELVKSTLEKIV